MTKPSAENDDRRESVFLTPKEAAAYLRVSQSYLDKLRVYGGGPSFARLSPRKVVYERPKLDEWARIHTFKSTSEYAAT